MKENEIEIRYVEQYTVQVATNPIVLDMDEFKNCDPPFVGNDLNEFMNYLKNHVRHVRDYTNKNENILSQNSIDTLWYMTEHGIDDSDTDVKTIKDSRNNGSNFWFELGKTNPEHRNNGGFETLESEQGY